MDKKIFIVALLGTASLSLIAQNKINWDSLGREAKKTEVYNLVPVVVTPGNTPQEAPSDAIMLFNGKDLSVWNADDSTKPITWKVADGTVTVDNSHGHGGIHTKQKFTDYQLHLEWREPVDVSGEGESRGNSGVYLAVFSIIPLNGMYGERGYEMQILESYNNNNKVYVPAYTIHGASPIGLQSHGETGPTVSFRNIWIRPS